MSDLRQRVPGHSLIEQLLREWDLGNIHPGKGLKRVVIDDEAMGWYLGVHGERWVAARLALLGPEYTVLHSVPVGSGTSDIDHVVVGPAGVFTINTKYSPGKKVWSAGWGVFVGGREEKHFVRNMALEVRRASTKLSRATGLDVNAMGLIVFVDPAGMDRKGPAGDGALDIRVISDAELIATIGDRTVFTPDEVAQLAEAAARPETWHDSPTESTIGAHIAQEFSALETAVGPLRPHKAKATRTRPTRKQPTSATSPRPSRVGAAAKSPQRRPRARKGKSALETLFGLAILLGLAYLMTQPDGQAFLTSVFGP